MPAAPSTRLQLVAPTGTDQGLTLDDRIAGIVARLEAVMPTFRVWASADLPGAGTVGELLHATSWGVSYIWTGTKWRVFGGYTGMFSFTSRTVDAPGFLAAVGQPVTTAYPELRNALLADGSPWGASGGNPLLPTTASRALVGAGTGAGLTARAAGAVFGAETHALQPVESAVPPHAHVMPADPGHAHAARGVGIAQPAAGTWEVITPLGPDTNAAGNPILTATTGITQTGAPTAQVPGNAHNNVQPSVALRLLVQT